jgi:hypothetical protein
VRNAQLAFRGVAQLRNGFGEPHLGAPACLEEKIGSCNFLLWS